MIYFLRGKVAIVDKESIVIDVRDVGYQMLVSHLDQYQVGEEVLVYTYNVVREDENYLESWFDASLLNIIKKGQNNYFSRSPIVAYVLLKYLEFKKVRLVFSSEECSESELIKIKERLKAAWWN